MKRKLCCACGVAALAFIACSEDNGSNALNEQGPVAGISSSLFTETSSSSLEPSSSSLLGLSSSMPVPKSSNSVRPSSSSAAALSSSSLLHSSSSKSCQRMLWNGPDADSSIIMVACGDSTWPKNAVADGRWRVMETDSSCVYCDYAGQATSGYSSVVFWPDSISMRGGEVPTSAIEFCSGVCGFAVLSKGTLTFQPFVSIGFTLAKDDPGKSIPVDVSKWGGICISYASEVASELDLDLGDSLNAVLEYALPAASLPKSSEVTKKCITWEQFKIPSWFRGGGLRLA